MIMQIIWSVICVISFTIFGIAIGYKLGYHRRIKKISKNRKKPQRIAEKDKTLVELLVDMSKSKDIFIREIPASDCNTPLEVLIKLTKDEDFMVRLKAKREFSRRGKQGEISNMFKLVELSIGYFAIVKSYVETDTMPINIQGFIQVIENKVNGMQYEAVSLKGLSKELIDSGEIEALKNEAIEQTKEAIADEFPD